MNLKPKYYTEDMDALLLCSTEFSLSPLDTPQKYSKLTNANFLCLRFLNALELILER